MDKFLNLANGRQPDYVTKEDCEEPFDNYNEGLNKYNQCGCKKSEINGSNVF